MTEIRRASRTDVDALLDLWQRAESTPGVTDTPADLARVIEHDGAAVFVAIDGGVIIGSVIATFDGWRGNLYRVAVDPAYRRRGLARALVEEAEQWLHDIGARRVSALVEGSRPVAQLFWSAAGFVPYEGMRRYTKSV